MLEGYRELERCYEGVTRPLFRAGSGPGVVLIHEIPGITPEAAALGQRLVAAGFTVFLPSLFGEPGVSVGIRSVSTEILRSCVSRELWVLTRRGSSPVTRWLRALCRDVHAELGGPGVGVIGMCMTGNFALTLMADPSVMAPVLSQPSLPFGVTASRRAAIQMTDAEIAALKARLDAAPPGEVGLLGLRFTGDWMCPAARFQTLRDHFGDRFEGIEIPSGPGSDGGVPFTAHSVLTLDFVDQAGHPTRQAMDRVLAFLHTRLQAESARA